MGTTDPRRNRVFCCQTVSGDMMLKIPPKFGAVTFVVVLVEDVIGGVVELSEVVVIWVASVVLFD